MILVRINDGAAVFLAIVIVLATIGLSYLLFKSVKKEQKKYNDEQASYIEGVLTKTEMIANITSYISKSNFLEFSLLLIDLDNIPNLVNTFGQNETNSIIEKLAYTVLDTLPKRVDLARFDEDKFLVFVKGEYDRKDAINLTKEILEAIRKPIKVYGESVITVTASIGVSFFPAHGRNFKALNSSLEMATYICKRSGGNQYNIYSAELNEKESENLEYYHQIKNAIKNKEFDLYYQPMIDCENNKIYGFEGLLRWNHPELGILSPYKFINIMEQSGDINWVGLWGLETLITKYEDLRRKYPDVEFKLSMNMSPKQLANPTLVNDFQKVIKRQKMPAKTIIIEIEEFALFEKHETVKKNIKMLSELGFGIAVDGFGLDYGALTKIDVMPIDIIKLDNDFLNEETDSFVKEKFASLLISYSTDQHKTIVCEGIEDLNMLNKALARRIYLVQGYYFSKPMSQDELDDYIFQQNWNEKVAQAVKIDPKVINELLEKEENKDTIENMTSIEDSKQVEEVIDETKIEKSLVEDKEEEKKENKSNSKKTKKTNKSSKITKQEEVEETIEEAFEKEMNKIVTPNKKKKEKEVAQDTKKDENDELTIGEQMELMDNSDEND